MRGEKQQRREMGAETKPQKVQRKASTDRAKEAGERRVASRANLFFSRQGR